MYNTKGVYAPSPQPVTPSTIDMKLLFVEMGTGYDQHGMENNSTLSGANDAYGLAGAEKFHRVAAGSELPTDEAKD
ncbi:unnamed protein product [Calypogeia fissa]